MKIKLVKILAVIIVIAVVAPLGAINAFAEDIEGINLYYYRIVYPSAAGSDAKKAAQELGNYLNEYCKAEVEVVADVGNKPINKEIIIGNTNRPAASDVVMKEKDWCVYTDGTKIYINAYSEGALPLAIEWFKHNCLINGSRKAYVGDGYFYSHEYSFDGFTIDGAPADELVIAYDNNDHIGFVDVAYSLTYSFMDNNGLPLEVGAVAEREEPQLIIASALNGAKYLPLGVTVGASEYVICKNGKDIVVIADSSYGAELAAERISDMINSGKTADLAELCSDTPVSYAIGKDTLPLSYGAEYRFMSFNPGRYVLIAEDRRQEILATMAYYSPDVIGFQEYCDYFSRNMTSQLDDIGYTLIGDELCRDLPENADDWLLKYNMTPIAYKTDRFDCIASGWQRMDNTFDTSAGRNYRGHQITWAVLRDKGTGETFGVTTTHFFHLNDRNAADPVRLENANELIALVESLVAQYGCPFISVGDYNSYASDDAYKKLESSALFADSRNLAVSARMITAAGHTYGKINTSVKDCIDYIFVTDGVSVIRNKIAINEITAAAGDHFPIFSDVIVGETADNGGAGQGTGGAQTQMEFAGISASEYASNAANGKTTVGRNNYAPVVEIKMSAPLEEDEFWEMKCPTEDSPADEQTGTGENAGNEADESSERGGLFGCGSSINCGALLLVAVAAGICSVKNTRKERK